jgi:WD40 repeat protein
MCGWVGGQVRLYDEATKTLQSTLSGGLGYQRVGHSNRVFSLKFCSQDDHMLLSAGWDNTVQVLLVKHTGGAPAACRLPCRVPLAAASSTWHIAAPS